jgi:hypothetical protein
MADIPQLLANYDALVGVALGAGLTYGFGALNRRHQETREDRTRWYDARFKAYTDFYVAITDVWSLAVQGERTREERQKLGARLRNATAQVQLVGSSEAVELALAASGAIMKESARTTKFDDARLTPLVHRFLDAARQDLGHPEP